MPERAGFHIRGRIISANGLVAKDELGGAGAQECKREQPWKTGNYTRNVQPPGIILYLLPS